MLVYLDCITLNQFNLIHWAGLINLEKNLPNATIKRKKCVWMGKDQHLAWSFLSMSLSVGVRLCVFAPFVCSKVSVVQYWLQGYRHTHTNGVFCGKWLWCLSITLHCYCIVPLLIYHSTSQLHMAQRVFPPTPCLPPSHSHRLCCWALCVVLWRENKSSTVNAVKCTREYYMGFYCIC